MEPQEQEQLYDAFLKEFPLETLKEMPLEQYTNLNRSDSFCYWLESKTSELGSIWGGSSFKFGIYKYARKPQNPNVVTSDDAYAWYVRYHAQDRTEAYQTVLSSIISIAQHAAAGNFDAIDQDTTLGEVYKWKIAFLYSNKHLVPIYKRRMLVDAARALGFAQASKASIPALQKYLIERQGSRAFFEYYAYLLSLIKTANQADEQKHVWLYSPGEGAHKWQECLDNGEICIGWGELGDLSQYASKQEMQDEMKQAYGDGGYRNDSLATWSFAQDIKVGDVIFAKKGRSSIIGRGIVKGEYVFDEGRAEYPNIRTVQWDKVGEWPVEGLAMKTLTDITYDTAYVAKLNALVEESSSAAPSLPDETCGCWWLNANPKIWSMAEWVVGQEQSYTLLNEAGHKRRVYQNFLDAKAGDRVICYESTPTKQVVGLATISRASDGTQLYFRKEETLTTPIDYADIKDIPELQQMEFMVNPNGSFFKLTQAEYDVLLDLVRERNGGAQKVEAKPYSEADFLRDVYIKEEDFLNMKGALMQKKNLILQGAPGVGKTYTAKRLAYVMMGKVDDSRICFVQFHQNYSYEDFIMGYKPSEDSFVLRKGIFYDFCTLAKNNPKQKYFFIIDEINRGNLSKIFGELLMLIERDYRGDKHKITLAYNGERFYVPENLYIIGMMNTADRSLAMIDYALRRRFCFFAMQPGFDSAGFINYMQGLHCDKLERLVRVIKELNEDIRQDDSLGAGFEIGHSYLCSWTPDPSDDRSKALESWLHAVVHYDLIPMLEEYWFDNRGKVDTWSARLKDSIQ